MTIHPWDTVPIVFITAPACPECGAARPLTVKSLQNGDGSVTRRSTCRHCLARFLVVVEPTDVEADLPLPEFGRDRGRVA